MTPASSTARSCGPCGLARTRRRVAAQPAVRHDAGVRPDRGVARAVVSIGPTARRARSFAPCRSATGDYLAMKVSQITFGRRRRAGADVRRWARRWTRISTSTPFGDRADAAGRVRAARPQHDEVRSGCRAARIRKRPRVQPRCSPAAWWAEVADHCLTRMRAARPRDRAGLTAGAGQPRCDVPGVRQHLDGAVRSVRRAVPRAVSAAAAVRLRRSPSELPLHWPCGRSWASAPHAASTTCACSKANWGRHDRELSRTRRRARMTSLRDVRGSIGGASAHREREEPRRPLRLRHSRATRRRPIRQGRRRLRDPIHDWIPRNCSSASCRRGRRPPT